MFAISVVGEACTVQVFKKIKKILPLKIYLNTSDFHTDRYLSHRRYIFRTGATSFVQALHLSYRRYIFHTDATS